MGTATVNADAGLRDELARLRVLVNTDELTGVLNRRGILAALRAEVARSRRERRIVGILAIDIDHFKGVNDSRGHGGGDDVLRRVGACLGASVRRYDRVGRMGGDEFLIVMPGGYAPMLCDWAARIAAAVVRDAGVTVSIGAHEVSVTAGDDDTADAAALQAADMALYLAKSNGRNRVEVL